jgi:multidrug efflux system membrane fusion protein
MRAISDKRARASLAAVGLLLAAATALAILLLPACSSNGKAEPKPVGSPPAPVAVAAAVLRDIPVQIEAIGNVEAYSTVAVKSQVEGQIKQVHFREGQEVAKGALLLTIDPRPFEADLKEAQAKEARDEALAGKAEKDAPRYKELVARDLVSRQQYDQARADADSLRATVRADAAAVDNARLKLAYCYIHAPVAGRTGSLLVHAGNIVKADADNPMLVIHQVEPIYVTFAVPEKDLPDIRRAMNSSGGKLEVAATPPEATECREECAKGVLTFIDNAVDQKTGTIVLKGTFGNRDRRLWPGQYARAVLTLAWQKGALLVPSQAVQTGQEGKYVFVVRPDLTAEARPVVAGRTFGGETVIEKGLREGERVVTDGWIRLAPGTKVEIKAAPGTQPTGAATPAAGKAAQK